MSAPGPRISKSKTAFFNPAEHTECALSLRLACACPCPPRGPPRGSTPWIICEPGTRETDRQGTRACETILYKSLLFLTMPYKSLTVKLTKTFITVIKQSKSYHFAGLVPKTYQKTPYGNNGFFGALSMRLAFLEKAKNLYQTPSRAYIKNR